jgi:cytidylate kinase
MGFARGIFFNAKTSYFIKGEIIMSLITITASIGCGAMVVARQVAEDLGLALYDDSRLQEEAVKLGLSSQDLKSFDVKAPGLFSRLLGRKPAVYLELTAALVYEVARRGQGIIFGHGAPFFLRDFGCALHLRLHASRDFRSQRLMAQRSIQRETAEKLIQQKDDELSDAMQFSFRMDWNDLSLYDLVIKVDKLGLNAVATQIIGMARTQQIQECSLTALETMEKLSLLKRIEAAVLKSNISPHELAVEVPDRGVVRISGLINPMHTKAGVVEIVKSVSGVSKVIFEAERHPLPKI